MAIREFRLPDPGEGLVEADIVTWRVGVGDTVQLNDIVVEVETSKSLVELPSPYAGTVRELLVAEGDTVNVGTPIIAIDDGEGAEPPPPRDDLVPDLPETAVDAETDGADGEAPGGRVAVLVGYGPKTSEARRRPRKTAPASTDPAHAGGARPARGAPSPPTRRCRGGPTSGSRCSPPRGSRWAARCPGRGRRWPSRWSPAERCWPSRRCGSWPRTSAST